MRTRTAALLTAVVVGSAALSGCGTDSSTDTGAAGNGAASEGALADGLDTSSDEALPEEVAAMLGGYGVSAEAGVRDAIATLDHADDQRPLSVQGSVRADEVIFSDGSQEVSVPIPGDQVYVSIAPYVQQTHDCHYHALGSCQGEMVGEDVHVTITDDDGETLVDEDVTTYTNGFFGVWLPEGRQGTVTVTQGELTGQTPFDTGEGGATCITTLQLG